MKVALIALSRVLLGVMLGSTLTWATLSTAWMERVAEIWHRLAAAIYFEPMCEAEDRAQAPCLVKVRSP